MRAGFTVTTLRQSDNPPSGKAPHHQGQKRPDRWKAMSKAWSSLSLMWRGLCTKNLSQQVKLWIPGSTVTLCGDCVKTLPQTLARTDPAASPWQCPVSHFCPHPAVSGEKQNGRHPPPTALPWFGTLWLLFPKIKLKLKGCRFDTTEEIQDEAQRVLDTLIEKDFHEAFQKWRRRWPIGLKVSFTIFTVSVRKILDITT